MNTYTVQKEHTCWTSITVEADSFEEAITLSEAEENEDNWNPLENYEETGAYWVQDRNTNETYNTQGEQ